MRDPTDEVVEFYRAGPAGIPTQVAFSQAERWPDLDLDRDNGCIRTVAKPYNAEGGLAVLFGNVAERGCIVKTAGVDESIFTFSGPARVFESQDAACDGILDESVIQAGDVVVVRYEGPKGGPGMQEMLYPTSYIKSRGLGKECALLTDGRFSGGTSGLSIGHASPEAAEGGAIGLIEEGDMIDIDIPNRSINLRISDEELAARRAPMEAKGADAWQPSGRTRQVSAALQAYAALTTSADRGAVRDVEPAATMTDTSKPKPKSAGPEAVRRSLIDAAKSLMSMRSPRQVSGRELAQHAGVNYGLIHHYFGTKDNVFAEAVAEATEAMGQRWDDGAILPVNTGDEAASYRTFAKLEVDESRSPIADLIRRIVKGHAEKTGADPDDPELLADVAIATALQFGWGAFESDIVAALEEFGAEQDDLRVRVAARSTRLIADGD